MADLVREASCWAGKAGHELVTAEDVRRVVEERNYRLRYAADPPQGLVELRRVLKPGGTLSITESLTDPDYQFEDTVRDVCRASGFAPRDHHRGLLGFTMNFAAPPSR